MRSMDVWKAKIRSRFHAFVTLAGLLSIVIVTGCWDRRELNTRLFDLGTGIDLRGEGKYLLSMQFMLPMKNESSGKMTQSYIIETSEGINIFDALTRMQQKLSRKITRGQRRNLYIGEQMASSSEFHKLLDSLTRDPENRLRTDMWVVKANTALAIIKMPYPLESVPANAEIKIRQELGLRGGNSLLDYLIASNVSGNSPTLPAVEIVPNEDLRKSSINFYGTAIFNADHQLVGYLDLMESGYRVWILNQKNKLVITSSLPKKKETFSVDLTNASGIIHTHVKPDNRIKVDVHLTGKAILRENNSNYDMAILSNLEKFQTALNVDTQKKVMKLVRKSQEQFKADIFGIGETIERQHPATWKEIKSGWEEAYSKADIHVFTNITIERIGLQGQNLVTH